jgi:uncharacterized membrane-anchored protein YjiN (DUF445 family)
LSGKNRYLATGTLGVTSLLYFAALPFAGSFAGGLAASAFGAAMVGGLADWFAVSALFRKPLGIPWRTAVIPRNRERLFSMIVEMVQEELLAKDTIKRKIEEHDIPRVVLSYLDERGGAKTVKRMVHKLLSDILDEIDSHQSGRFIDRFIRQNAGAIRLSPLLRSIGEWTVQNNYDQKIISFVAVELANIAATTEIRGLLTEFLGKSLSRYEADKRRRKLFNHIARLSSDNMAIFVQQQLVAWLAGLKQADHPLQIALRQRLCRYLQWLELEPEAVQEWEKGKTTMLAGLDIAGLAQNAVEWLLRQVSEHPQQMAQWFRQADHLVDKMLAEFQADSVQQQKVSNIVRQALLNFIDAHHDKIGSLVRERLAQLSDAELVAFIEDKLGEDLQIIRVNGSIIGGLTGSILYCLTFWL